ncbi:hypothetical protein MXB_3261 [Myxobolus squamalis]|nr:hypothetical protein MXB_3261 [Myxobolus squamalis]
MSCECKSCICPKSFTPCMCVPVVVLFFILKLTTQACFVGTLAPQFEAEALFPDGSKIRGFVFLPNGFVKYFRLIVSTFVCPTEIIAFSEKISEFHGCGCEVIAASCDSVYSHLAWFVIRFLVQDKAPKKRWRIG